tara:strand:- start:846 stop:1094 length:249 start_codon:yes stop_codon:yes gene_type:complete
MLRTTTKQKAAAALANRIAALTKPLTADEINESFGTTIDFNDNTVDQVANEMTRLLQGIIEKLDKVNKSDRYPAPEIKRWIY